MPQNQNNNNDNTAQPQNPQQPMDKITGDTYVTEKNLEEILKKLNANLGDSALK